MYTKYFGFDKPPFKITPDPAFFFSGGNRGAVLEALLYAVARGEGIVKVVGEVGSGKTMLCRMLEHELPKDCEIVYIANPRLSPDEILHAIAMELELDVTRDLSKVEVMRVLHGFLLDKHARNRRVVMFIEEAQGMALDTLEEIRMLSNLETTQDKLLQIVLFGQPELNEKLAGHDIRQLKERITYAFDLTPLKRNEIRDYLNTRIRTSGFRGNDLFTRGAIRTLERRSRGLLRRINILADKALLAAFSRGDHQVTAQHLRMAARDSEFATTMPGPLRLAAAAGIAGAIVAGGIWWAGALAAAASSDPVLTAPRSLAPALPASVPDKARPSDDNTRDLSEIDDISDQNSDSFTQDSVQTGTANERAFARLDLNVPAPDTRPVLRPETLAALFR